VKCEPTPADLRADPMPASPSELFGDLLREVQMRAIFEDGKTFVDAVARHPADAIMAAYVSVPTDTAAIRAFVLANFDLPTLVAPHDTADWAPLLSLRDEIRRLWPVLTRPPHDIDQPGDSLLPVTRRYVVPGGRFRELYYWDSYFTMLGLLRDGHVALVDEMIEIFTATLERYGQIPNGMRSYYLGRSQPPVYHLMLDLRPASGRVEKQRRLMAMRKEHNFWMHGSETLAPGETSRRVVRLADGALLNRYWDDRQTPRDESFREDTLIAAASDRPPGDVFREIRAGAESGWDFSSRWLGDGHLTSIRTTSIVPVDLNSLIYGLECAIAALAADLDEHLDAQHFGDLATARSAAINRHLWHVDNDHYVDYDLETRLPRHELTAAALYPLFVGMASDAQAVATARATADLVAAGGLRTTATSTTEQWDAPNGWAPLQWVAVAGLRRYGIDALAETIRTRWIAMVEAAYRRSGYLFEKYDVEAMQPGRGGEYGVQEGFGWTNGVTAAFIDDAG
jgi:alpha,alpha-trehalase